VRTKEISRAVDDYLALIRRGSGDFEQDVEQLSLLLDHLCIGYRNAHYEFESGHPDPPDVDYGDIRELSAKRFPHFGHYNVPEYITTHLKESPLVMGDAIDDIADIARDLTDVEWCFANTGDHDALWHFRIGFETHWGPHARALQWYLEAFKTEHSGG
jgi:hypothetical protein